MGTNNAKIQVLIGGQYPAKVGQLIDQAKSSIEIIMYDWRWLANDPSSPLQIFNQTLVRAKRRGLKIRALVNSATILGPLSEVGIDAKKIKTGSLMHSKLLIIDHSIVVIGSHNISNNAFCSNLETSMSLEDEATAKTYLDYFNNLWQG